MVLPHGVFPRFQFVMRNYVEINLSFDLKFFYNYFSSQCPLSPGRGDALLLWTFLTEKLDPGDKAIINKKLVCDFRPALPAAKVRKNEVMG